MSPLPPGHADALAKICESLGGEPIDWTLTGSASFVLQGVDLDPDDIDLQTTEPGAYAIEERFSGSVTEPVTASSEGTIQSHFGELRIAGVPVEVMGALRKRDQDGEWESPVPIERHREFVGFRDHRVPVLSLEYEAQTYERLGRTARAELLRSHAD